MSSQNCPACDVKLIGRYLQLDGKRFHPECIKCDRCYQTIKDKRIFKTQDNEKICAKCHEAKRIAKMSKCHKCNRVITGIKTEFEGKDYHQECFLCDVCHLPALDPKVYINRLGVRHCMNCFLRKESNICFKCLTPTPFNKMYYCYDGRNIHEECLNLLKLDGKLFLCFFY